MNTLINFTCAAWMLYLSVQRAKEGDDNWSSIFFIMFLLNMCVGIYNIA
jgi:hypothetical protein